MSSVWGRAGRASPVDDADASRVEASPAAVISTPRSVASSSAGRFAARPAQKHPPPRLDRWRSISSGVRGDPIVRPALRRKHAARNHGGKHVPHIPAPDANARRGGHAPPLARRRVCVTTRDATVENHRDGQSAKTDDVDRPHDRRLDDGRCIPTLHATPRPATRGYRSRSNITTRTVPPSPPLSPSPSRSLHHVVVVEHFPGFVLVPPPRSSRGGCVSFSGDDDVPDPLGHPREMPRRSKRPRRRAALLHP